MRPTSLSWPHRFGACAKSSQTLHHSSARYIVTDTASTKGDVLGWAAEIFPREIHFVGGHPMAGKTRALRARKRTFSRVDLVRYPVCYGF